MEKRYTEKDFYVGQDVYSEYIGKNGSMLERGSISTETVTRVGKGCVFTDRRVYRFKDGAQPTDIMANFVLWGNKDEVETKIAKNKVLSKLVSLFNSDKELSLEDLREIERIVDKAMEE
jgi:hypothetical protein